MENIKKSAATSRAKNTVNSDFAAVVDQLLASLKAEAMEDIKSLIEQFNFPDGSIPFPAINLEKAMLSGDAVRGGTIRKFSSTGIEDLAKDTKLTILDGAVVVENRLVAQQLTVKGNVEIDGNVTILGDTGFDNQTTAKIVHSVGKQVYAHLKTDITNALENISGDHVKGGTITKFSSTGIEDLATGTQLTIMDNAVVIESKFAAQSLLIKEDATIEGNLTVKGDLLLDTKFSDHLIGRASDQVIKTLGDVSAGITEEVIKTVNGSELDVRNLLVNGRPMFEGKDNNSLAPFVRLSRLTQVGSLKELVVIGETQLCSSFYAGNKRVGINTLEPAAALAVWDEEVEMLIGKHSRNTGYIGSLRNQEVIIGAHNKTNIVLGTGGQTLIVDLIADKTRFFSGDKVPNFESETGSVCFNTKPALGKPFGWICLGGARWGIMGLVA